MFQIQEILNVQTKGTGLYEITGAVQDICRASNIKNGLLTLFIRHTSASLTIQENADPDVGRDLVDAFARLAPEDADLYRHRAEGGDDMPAHIRSALTDVSLSVPVSAGRAALGTWQGIYVFEHRRHAQNRQVIVHLIGE